MFERSRAMPDGLVLECLGKPYLQFVLTGREGTLGRSPKSQFVVNDPTISRFHAKLLRVEDGFAVFDLNSLNGTFVEEERIKSRRIVVGQRIRFGELIFLTKVEEIDEEDVQTASCDSAIDKAISPVASAGNLLSVGQKRVFDCLLAGEREKTIARSLKISPNTVHNHVQAIFRLLNVHSKAELIARYLTSELRNTRHN
jgi:DNA-binding CsgD family transcriptional regulator